MRPRAVGSVIPGANPAFRSEGRAGWIAVARREPGAYCLTPDPSLGLNFSQSTLVVTMGSGGGTAPGVAVWQGFCSLSPLVFQVRTWDFASIPTDEVSFTAMVV